MVRLSLEVARAARNEATHRMTYEDQLGDRSGPGSNDIVEQRGEVLTVLGDVESGVVAQIHGGVTKIFSEPRTLGGLGAQAMAIRVQPPRLLGFAQAMKEDRHLRRRLGDATSRDSRSFTVSLLLRLGTENPTWSYRRICCELATMGTTQVG